VPGRLARFQSSAAKGIVEIGRASRRERAEISEILKGGSFAANRAERATGGKFSNLRSAIGFRTAGRGGEGNEADRSKPQSATYRLRPPPAGRNQTFEERRKSSTRWLEEDAPGNSRSSSYSFRNSAPAGHIGSNQVTKIVAGNVGR